MKKVILLFGILLILVYSFQSCSIEKRRYLKGYHITPNFVHGKDVKKDWVDVMDQEIKMEDCRFDRAHPIVDSTLFIQNTSDSQPEQIRLLRSKKMDKELVTKSEFVTHGWPTRKETRSISEQSLMFVEKNSIDGLNPSPSSFVHKGFGVRAKSASNNEEKVHFFSRFLGVFLGVILALIALPILLLITFFIFDSDPDGLFEIGEKAVDSPFKKAFKMAFNGVVRIGLKILLILFFVFMTIAIIIGLYIMFGLIGVLIAVLFVILILYLMLLLMEGILGYILPGYKKD